MSGPSAGLRHEHEFEAELGLPEPLPAGERVLWQGAPDWRQLAVQAFHLRKVAIYFMAMLAWHAASAGSWIATAKLVPLAATALALLALMALLSARSTVYTLTDRRVVMRIGIVLTVTFNLPLARIEGAALQGASRGAGSIALHLGPADRIAWLHLWPHVRPWRVAHTEPMLRALPDAAAVAELLTQAWCAARAQPLPVRAAAAPDLPPQLQAA